MGAVEWGPASSRTGASRVDFFGEDDRAFIRRAFVIPGLTYPLWPFVLPRGAIDPHIVWVGIGLLFLSVPLVHWIRPLKRDSLQNIMSLLSSGVTLHLFMLASLNDMSPIYALGSSFAVLGTALFIRSVPMLLGYAAFVVALSSVLFLLEPDDRKLAHWGGMLPLLFFAYHRLTIELAQWRELEDQVQERTQQLSHTNTRLLAEIEERTRLQDELRVTHKMEAIGRLAGGVAHDFNNLLTTIGVYSELVLGGLPDESPLRNEVRQIQKANDQAASLTQQLLTLGRRSHVQVERIDLNEVITDAAPMLRHLVGGNTQLVIQLDPKPQPILGNIDQLQQILINLAINARDAMSGAGRFMIETSRCPASELAAQEIAASPTADEYVWLSVSDTGSGMDAEARERAFDPFFTTKEPDRGAGLGLSIVHGIVSQAEGHVRLHSESGKGTRFDLIWPLGQSTECTDVSVARPAGGGRNEEVLLVEDEGDLREALHRVLAAEGYRVTEADSGETALEIALQHGAGFDLVVTDVVMPHMSGFELAERVAVAHPGTKLLLISGHLSDRALEQMPTAIPFLAKPFSAADLTDKVRELLDDGETIVLN